MVLQYSFHLPLNKLVKKDFWHAPSWVHDTNMLLKEVPADMSLAASQHIVPHVSHRKEIYLIWPRKKNGKEAQNLCGKQECWWLDFAGKPQYLLVNKDEQQWVTQLLESPQHFNEALENMENAGKISKAKQINTAYLYTVHY